MNMFVEKAEADVLAANWVVLIKKVNWDGRIYCNLILDLDDCETRCRGKLQTWAPNKCGVIDCFIGIARSETKPCAPGAGGEVGGILMRHIRFFKPYHKFFFLFWLKWDSHHKTFRNIQFPLAPLFSPTRSHCVSSLSYIPPLLGSVGPSRAHLWCLPELSWFWSQISEL